MRTLVVSQLSAALSKGLHAWLGPGYLAAALALVGIIALMLVLNAMHPPAVGTALSLAFHDGPGEGSLVLFGLAVGLVLVLLVVQRGAAFLFHRFTTTS